MKDGKLTTAEKEPSAWDLVEETFHFLRQAPLSVWAFYYLGTVPFALALLFFWADMSHSAFAADHLAGGALVMATLFCWMKCCQSLYAAELDVLAHAEPPPRWTWRRLLRVALMQGIVQPTGLVVLPITSLLLFPFSWAYTFYQNVTVLGTGEEPSLTRVIRTAWRQALLWPSQHNLLNLGLLLLMVLVVYLNWSLLLITLPRWITDWLGISLGFRVDRFTLQSSTANCVLATLTYLTVDPFLKACFVVRCFHGRALQSGDDLRAFLRRLRQASAALVLGWLFTSGATDAAASPLPPAALNASPVAAHPLTPSAAAAAQGVDPQELSRRIDEVMSRPEFKWRLGRERHRNLDLNLAWWERILRAIAKAIEWPFEQLGRAIERAVSFVRNLFKLPSGGGSVGVDWASALTLLFWLLVLLLVGAVGWLVYRIIMAYRAPSEISLGEEDTVIETPDLAAEDPSADRLPEAGWLRMAEDYLNQGDLRLALRALYLATLAHLAERGLIRLAKHKSNLDYVRELRRRAHVVPELAEWFAATARLFDEVWYGLHQVSRETVEQIRDAFSRAGQSS